MNLMGRKVTFGPIISFVYHSCVNKYNSYLIREGELSAGLYLLPGRQSRVAPIYIPLNGLGLPILLQISLRAPKVTSRKHIPETHWPPSNARRKSLVDTTNSP